MPKYITDCKEKQGFVSRSHLSTAECSLGLDSTVQCGMRPILNADCVLSPLPPELRSQEAGIKSKLTLKMNFYSFLSKMTM